MEDINLCNLFHYKYFIFIRLVFLVILNFPKKALKFFVFLRSDKVMTRSLFILSFIRNGKLLLVIFMTMCRLVSLTTHMDDIPFLIPSIQFGYLCLKFPLDDKILRLINFIKQLK